MFYFKNYLGFLAIIIMTTSGSNASSLYLDCKITKEITDRGFFEINSNFSVETDKQSMLIINMPPEGSIFLSETFKFHMNNLYANVYHNLTSKSAFLQKDIFSLKHNEKWYFKYIVIRINQTIGFEAICDPVRNYPK